MIAQIAPITPEVVDEAVRLSQRERRKVERLMRRLKAELERLVEAGVKRDMEAAAK